MSYLPIPIPTFTTYIHVGRGLCTKKPISKSKKTIKGGTVHKTSIPNIGRVVLRSKYRIQGDNTDKHLLDNNTMYLFITTWVVHLTHGKYRRQSKKLIIINSYCTNVPVEGRYVSTRRRIPYQLIDQSTSDWSKLRY